MGSRSSKKTDVLRDETATPVGKWGGVQRVGYDADDALRNKIIETLYERPNSKLRQLVDYVSIEGGYKKGSVVMELITLQDEGVIGLSEPRGRRSFARYASSPDSSWFSASLAAVAVAVALVFAPVYLIPPSLSFIAGPIVYLRYFFGGVLVIFLPGYSLLQALYASKFPFDDLTRYALSFVMSFATVILISLVLGGSPIGLETLPVTAAVAAFTVVMLSIGARRRYGYYEISHYFDEID